MDKNPRQIYRHKSVRLKNFDYSQSGSYFVTICTRNREPLFGEIKDGEMLLNDVGKIVKKCVSDISAHYPHVELDKFVIMPNHVHMIITIYPDDNNVEAQNFVPLQHNFQHVIPGSISSIIRGFKTGVTKWCRKHTNIRNIWQRNYYEHVIRNEKELNKIRLYIINNPPKWDYDRENQNGLPVDEKKQYWTKFFNEYADESL